MKQTQFTRVLCVLLTIAFVLSAAACAVPKATESATAPAASEDKKVENITIRVGTQPTTMGTPLEYALNNNWFDGTGITVERILFPTGAPINEALAAGELDIAINGLATVYAVAAGDVTWIGEINNAGGLGIYVRPDSPVLQHKGEVDGYPDMYGSTDTLKDLVFLGPLGTSAQFNVITYMNHFGLTATDYQMLSMDHGPACQAFLAGEGDAIASSPPYTTQLEAAGMVKLCSLEEASGIVLMDGVCARRPYLAENRDAVKKFMEVIYRAQEMLGNDDKLVYDTCFAYYNENGRETSEADMNAEIEQRDFVDKDIMTAPDYKFGSVIYGMGQFYVDDGKIAAEDFENIKNGGVDPSILEEIYGITIPVYQP